MEFKILFINYIQNHIIQSHLKLYFFNEIRNHIFQWNFNIILIYKAALYLAVEKENIEIVKALLMNNKFDINLGHIFLNFLIKFKIIFCNIIKNHIFQYNSKSWLSMKFKIISFNTTRNHIFQFSPESERHKGF